jgi:hypothetical protein
MNAVAMTTIRPPNRVTRQWLELCRDRDWRLIVAGDAKTPNDAWRALATNQPRLRYISLNDQADRWPELSACVASTYARKNFAYLDAMSNGTEWIFDTDDDNTPQGGFTPLDVPPQGTRVCAERVASDGCFNAFALFHAQGNSWPRGYPLDRHRIVGLRTGDEGEVESPVQQYLCDGDTDVDAIQRLLFGVVQVRFAREKPIYGPGLWCPINSQSCLWHRSSFAWLYLPSHCAFRVTDIARGMVATRKVWATKRQVTFHPPAVSQVRSGHDAFRDFCEEMPQFSVV